MESLPDPIQSSREAIAYVADQTSDVILSFSGGKDSLAAWLNLREVAPALNITPIYHYMVPRLAFVERYLDYVEGRMGVRILRLPHPRLTYWLRHASYQPPKAADQILDLTFPFRDYGDFIARAILEYDLPQNTWVAVGTTQNDSANRRLTFRKHGMVREAERKLFPIGDFTKTQIIDIIRRHGLKLSPDYRIWRRSFDGLDWFFLEGVRRHYPEDYERILDFFPMLKLEQKRYEMAAAHA